MATITRRVIKISIKEIITESYLEDTNLMVKRTPTEITETETNNYGSPTKTKVQHVEEFAVTQVQKYRDRTVTLLEQEIEDVDTFELGHVIMAINGMLEIPANPMEE